MVHLRVFDWHWFKVFESEESNDTRFVFFFNTERMSLFFSEPLFHFLHARLVLMGQRQEQTSSPEILELAHLRFDTVCQSVKVRQSSQFCIVGKKYFGIAEHRQLDFVGRFRGLIVPIAIVFAELLELSGWNVELYSFGDGFSGGMSSCDFHLDYSLSRIALYPVSHERCSLFATSDVRFFFGDGELERLLDKPFDFFSYRFRIGVGADDADDEIVRKTAILESTETRVKWISAWVLSSKPLDAFDGSLDFLKVFLSCPLSLQGVILLPETVDFPAVVLIRLVGSASVSLPKVFLDGFHEAI